MKPKLTFVNNKLESIKKKNLYREIRFGQVNRAIINIKNKKLVNFCSNDYLGISISDTISRQMQSSSRLVGGNDISFQILEKKLAKHKSQESSLVFPTGYMANVGVISTIIEKKDLILSDELNHASIIEACKLTGAKISIYKHNDINDLSSKLNQHHKRKFVISEGIFSMDGDYANLKEIVEIAEKKDAIIILDDAHGDFTVGEDGKGTPNHFGVTKKIDLYVSSLSKGLGSFGGYVATQKNIIEFLINRSKSFIYTSALPSFLVEYSLKKLNSDREKQRKKLWKNVELLSSGLKQIGYDFDSSTHIIPLIIGNEKTALEFGKYLFKKGVYALPIRYPTVPKNKARIRISVTAWLTKKHIENALKVFELSAKKFGII
ncbi:MAG: pyridoxal phosphate-dependent aminotransferase family protein [Nitrososphaerota archaeon]|nr:pyridoxal phosphate-dependent aminotransferase family protein [Nitrososphaerota archaeon]MDG7054240.1 pyridoxal phosphate-dependent aminotransferase family protein [Nitrososphaerota archaeon]